MKAFDNKMYTFVNYRAKKTKVERHCVSDLHALGIGKSLLVSNLYFKFKKKMRFKRKIEIGVVQIYNIW